MRQCKMRYDGYTWKHNPKLLRFKSSQNAVTVLPPFSKSDVRILSEEPYTIEGQGELIGSDCIEQYQRLKALFSERSSGLLTIEGLPSFYVRFLSLDMTAEPVDHVLSYSFSFKEAKVQRTDVSEEEFCVVSSDGTTLWDIAYQYGKTIEELIRLNPDIRFIDELYEGEKVRICSNGG